MDILTDKIVGYITLCESDTNKWRISYLTEFTDTITVLVVQNPECIFGMRDEYVIDYEDELYILISYSGWWSESHIEDLNTSIANRLDL